jgi:hypothetical protein
VSPRFAAAEPVSDDPVPSLLPGLPDHDKACRRLSLEDEFLGDGRLSGQLIAGPNEAVAGPTGRGEEPPSGEIVEDEILELAGLGIEAPEFDGVWRLGGTPSDCISSQASSSTGVKASREVIGFPPLANLPWQLHCPMK